MRVDLREPVVGRDENEDFLINASSTKVVGSFL